MKMVVRYVLALAVALAILAYSFGFSAGAKLSADLSADLSVSEYHSSTKVYNTFAELVASGIQAEAEAY